MNENAILYQIGQFWVCVAHRGPKFGFEVYRDGTTHAVRCATIGYMGERGLARAKEEANKRASRLAPTAIVTEGMH